MYAYLQAAHNGGNISSGCVVSSGGGKVWVGLGVEILVEVCCSDIGLRVVALVAFAAVWLCGTGGVGGGGGGGVWAAGECAGKDVARWCWVCMDLWFCFVACVSVDKERNVALSRHLAALQDLSDDPYDGVKGGDTPYADESYP